MMKMWSRIALLLLAQGTAACGTSSTAPSASPPIVAAPVVTSIVPNVGSTTGAAMVKIDGTNLGTAVTFGGTPVQGKFFAGNPTLYLSAPPHAAGLVDVVVTGQHGERITLTNAYTYVSASTFDFNGAWMGYGESDGDERVSFTIRNDVLLSVSCGEEVTLTLSPAPRVSNGEFSYRRDDGVSFSGRIVAAGDSTGSITLGSCQSTEWHARKQ
jgi:hypothetical protein